MSWEKAQKLAEKHADGAGIFVRLANDKDRVVGVFCGEPYTREVVWTGEKYETYNSLEHEQKPTLKVALNFYVLEEHAMKIIEGGTIWFRDVCKARDKYGIDKWSFEIQRHGAAGDSKTRYTILPEERLTPEQTAEIAAEKLHDLADIIGGESAEPEPTKDTTISPEMAGMLAMRLKAFPRETAIKFLTNLNVKSVREIKVSQVGIASKALEKLETSGPHSDAAEDIF